MLFNSFQVCEREVQLSPNILHSRLKLAGLYAQLGQHKEAKIAAEEVHRITSVYSWAKYGKVFYVFNNKEVDRRFCDGLRKLSLN